MNWWEALIINSAAGAIRTFVKNPKSAAQYQAVIQHIHDDTEVILEALNVTAPPTT